jgi:4-amino-4-deoxy-L-arabinose transferase-like glycosyltransferase
MLTPRRAFALLALALLMVPLAASAPLFDPDEGLHASIAQEMVLRGDYVTPTFLGEPFLDKPILFFWAEAASLRLFGDNETAVRVPPLLFGLFGMFAVAVLGRAMFGASAGLLSGAAYATMILPLGVSQVAVHDIGLVGFMCIACWCVARIADASELPLVASADPPVAAAVRRKILLLSALAGLCLGLSILTKGLVGIVVTGIFAACLAAYRPSTTMRLAVALSIAIGVAILVALPWYIAMERAHPGYLHYYFVERHLQGYLTATQRHAGRPFWYYLPIVAGGALPWTAYLVGAARSARGNPLRLVVWAWFGIALVFLSVGESKLVTYALPLFPALAILAGDHVDRAPRPAGLTVHVAALALLPPLGLVGIQWKYGASHPWVWAAVLVCSALTIAAGLRAARAGGPGPRLSWIAAMSIAALAGMVTVSPRAAAWMTGRDLAAALNVEGALPPRVSVVDERIGSLVFYLDPPLRAEATRERLDEASLAEAIARARLDAPDAVIAVRNTMLPRFNRLFDAAPRPDARAGTFTLFRAETLRRALAPR